MRQSVRASGTSLKPAPCLLHPDMFAGYTKSRSACLPYMRNSVRMRSLKLRAGQVRFDKDFERLYDPSPKRKLSMLRSARRGSFTLEGKRRNSAVLTWSEGKTGKKSDSMSLEAGKKARLDMSESIIEKATFLLESKRFSSSTLHAGQRSILGEANRHL